jgi:hypothetical protein
MVAFLVVIAAVIFIGYQLTPEEEASPAFRANTEETSFGQSDRQFDYDVPKQKDHYYDDPVEEEKPVLEYKAPLSTPRIKGNRRVNRQSDQYLRYPDSNSTAPTDTRQGVDYQKGYGVQLLATEKGWWEDTQALRLKEKYPRLELLVGTGYGREGEKVNKFLIGAFSTKEEADEFAQRISKEFSGAFAVELSTLERAGRYWSVP